MIEAAKISINYIAKLEYTGSFQGMRFMLKKMEETQTDENGEEVKKKFLRTFVWPEPLSYAKTDPEKIRFQDFPFSSSGKEEAVQWLNELYMKGGQTP